MGDKTGRDELESAIDAVAELIDRLDQCVVPDDDECETWANTMHGLINAVRSRLPPPAPSPSIDALVERLHRILSLGEYGALVEARLAIQAWAEAQKEAPRV